MTLLINIQSISLFIRVVIVSSCLLFSATTITLEEDSRLYKLPDKIKPVSYTIRLVPDIQKDIFHGSVIIRISIKANTDVIILHAKDLNITKEHITIEEVLPTEENYKTIIEIKDAKGFKEKTLEFFKITLKSELKICNIYNIHIDTFTGTLSNKKIGFYVGKYTGKGGNKKKFITTRFEPTYARMAFPCFDEPALKARFKVTLVRPTKYYRSLSNTPLIASRNLPDSDQLEDEFLETDEMSTYSVGFVISEMEYSDTNIVNNVQHCLVSRHEVIRNYSEKFVLDTSSRIIGEIENLLNVSYSLKKLDQVAIPDSYIDAESVRNWGLPIYRESSLLYSESTTTSEKQRITNIIAQQISYQWFGNLVSPKWWQYVWQNTGLALYLSHRVVDLLFNDWEMMNQFVVTITQSSFYTDSLQDGRRSMNQDAGSPAYILKLFDKTADYKSGAVIRMLEGFLTTQVFSKGLHYYLINRRYKDVQPEYLYESLQKAANENENSVLKNMTVSEIMNTWTNRKGYPVVNAQRNSFPNEKNVTIYLSQSCFLMNCIYTSYDNSWIIPINYATNSNQDFDDTTVDKWLSVQEDTLSINDLQNDDWLLINKKLTGYYRVNYDIRNWKLLIKALMQNHTQIHVINRAQLIDDSFNLARSGRLSYDIPFELSRYLKNETDFVPFDSFYNALSFLNIMLSESTAYSSFKNEILKLLLKEYQRLGYEERNEDTYMEKLNRPKILSWVCNLGNLECRSKALNMLIRWKSEDTPIPVDIQTPVLCGALRNGKRAEWEFVYTQYQKSLVNNDIDLSIRLFNALGCSENEDISEKFFNVSIEGLDKNQLEDAFSVACNSGSIGTNLALKFLVKQFDYLFLKLPNQLSNILHTIGNKLTTRKQLFQLQELAQQHKELQLFQKAIDAAEENIRWKNNRLFEITSWLEASDKENISCTISFSNYIIILICLITCFI